MAGSLNLDNECVIEGCRGCRLVVASYFDVSQPADR